MDLDLDATTSDERAQRYWRLIEIGIALAAERDHNRLMEQILLGAKALTNADGGTLYLVSRDGGELRFMIMRNDSMKIALGGTTGSAIPFPPVPLRASDGGPNYKNVAAAAALGGQTINIADSYDIQKYDFSCMGAFDERTGS